MRDRSYHHHHRYCCLEWKDCPLHLQAHGTLCLASVVCFLPGGYSRKFFMGRPRHEVQPLPFYVPFLTEKAPLSYTLYWQMVALLYTKFRPFRLILLLKMHCLLNTNKRHKTRTFSQFFHSRDLFVLRALQTKAEIPHHSIILLQLVKSPPFHKHEAWKRYSFQAEPPCLGHMGGGGGGGKTKGFSVNNDFP